MKFRASLLRYATGNHLNFNEDSVLVASQPMTPECFNYFEIRCGRGNDLAIALSEYVDLELCALNYCWSSAGQIIQCSDVVLSVLPYI